MTFSTDGHSVLGGPSLMGWLVRRRTRARGDLTFDVTLNDGAPQRLARLS